MPFPSSSALFKWHVGWEWLFCPWSLKASGSSFMAVISVWAPWVGRQVWQRLGPGWGLSPGFAAQIGPWCLMSRVCSDWSSVRRVIKHCWPPGWQSAHSSTAPWAPGESWKMEFFSDLSWSHVSIRCATCDTITRSLCLCKNQALLTVPKQLRSLSNHKLNNNLWNDLRCGMWGL